MAGPLHITETGFEVWKMVRVKGREVFLTRRDEDRLCDILRDEFGEFQVVNENKSWKSPDVEWRARISDYPVSDSPPEFPLGVTTVEIYFPWPKWELRAEPHYWNKYGTPEEIEASFAGYSVLTSSPLSIRLNRSKFLSVDMMTGYPWQREALTEGFIQTAWCSEGPYVEAQQAFVRKLFRLLGKMTTNRLRYLQFDEAGEIVNEEAKKGYSLWAGDDALRWLREDERRVLTYTTALYRETGRIAWGYRPLD